jgi:hypothetical protein
MVSTNRKLLLVSGAGASTELASDSDRPLPLMVDWAERLRAKIGTGLSAMTGLDTAQDGAAFEETLGALFRWLESLDATERFRLMVRPNEQVDDNSPNQLSHLLGTARAHGDRFLEMLHESLFEEFGPDRIDSNKAVTAYRGLFEALNLGDPFPAGLVCATTNYDRSLEIALGAMGMGARTGFTSHAFRTPVLDPRGLGGFSDDAALLYLHGAVGWYRQADGSIVAMPADQGFNPTLGRPAVLYPSPNKDPEISETAALWSEFRTAVQEATHILVLGHGLNDGHLVGELASTKARIAITYLSAEAATAAGAEHAEGNEQRIKKLLPGATPIAARFGPQLAINQATVKKWRS